LSCPYCKGLLVAPEGADSAVCSACGRSLSAQETVADGRIEPVSAQPFRLPGFEVRGELGRGGMGIVYRAWQISLGREVALKVLPPALAADRNRVARFRNEATIAAGLTDAHVIPVFDVLEADGAPILVMPLIQGTDLGRIIHDRQAVKSGKLARPSKETTSQPQETPRTSGQETPSWDDSGSPDGKASEILDSPGVRDGRPHPWAFLEDRTYLQKVLPLLDQIVDAVTAIHQAKNPILHRDIKPSNVLVDGRGNLWLSDFGLARLDTARSMVGAIVGTRGYMAPEQGRGEEIDFRADVFSLGATLYKAVTLEFPFKVGEVPAKEDLPTPASSRQPLLSRDYDAVLGKALEPSRDRRYRDAADFREDWQRVRAGQLPRARRIGFTGRVARSVRRHPLTAVGLLSILFLAGGLVYALVKSEVDRNVYRTVGIRTKPAGARIALVPIDERSGEFLPGEAIRPVEVTQADRPLFIPHVKVGEYLVVAKLPDGRFHEVYRTVGALDTRPGTLEPRKWEELSDGTIELPAISLNYQIEKDEMTLFEGGKIRLASETALSNPERVVLPFYLDARAVTIFKYRRDMAALPVQLKSARHAEKYPVVWVTYDQALTYAERAGKRLLDEFEFEFAATNGGSTTYPWGSDEARLTGWKTGAVGSHGFDKTATNPPVLELFSNVACWTTSQNWSIPAELRPRFQDSQVVRGAPAEIISGEQESRTRNSSWFPYYRANYSRDRGYPGIGIRCARSKEPRFLEP
jgi:serine/threonine protein kinase